VAGWGNAGPVRPSRPPRRHRRGRLVTLVVLGILLAAAWQLASQRGPENGTGTRNGTGTGTESGTGSGPRGDSVQGLPHGADQPSTRPAPTKTGRPPGDVRDGALAFTLTGVRCGDTDLGSWPVQKHATGRFCLLDLRVRNVGGHAAVVVAGSQVLVDGTGREYPADDWAWLYYQPARDLAAVLNTDRTVTGTLVFDVPADTHATRVVLRDSPLSRGTPLTLP